MAASLNLKRRASGIFFVRHRVPLRFQALFGRAEVHHSTGVTDLRRAKIVAAELTARWHGQLLTLDSMDPAKIIAGSLELLGDGLIPLDYACDLLGTDRRRLVQELVRRHRHVYVHAQGWDGWMIEDIELLWHDRDESGLVSVNVGERELQRHGMPKQESRELAIRIGDEALAVATGAASVPVCMFMYPPVGHLAFVVPLPGRPLAATDLLVRRHDVEVVRVAFEALVRPQMVEQARPSPVAPSSASMASPKHAAMRLSAMVEIYLERKAGGWKPDTLRQNQVRAAALVELADNPVLADVDRDLMWAIARQLQRVPHDRDKVRRRFKVTEGGLKPLIAIADLHDLPRLTAKAQEKLVEGFAEIMAWAVAEGYLTRSPSERLGAEVFKSAGGRRARASDDRDALSHEDLVKIFSATWYQHGAGRRTAMGTFYYYRPHYYWLPLLALYAGGRLNELSQLYLDDVVVEADVAYLDFNLDGDGKLDADASDKSLKTANAHRLVPLHPRLIELGLLGYVDALRAAGHRRLFPELKHDATKGYGKAAGKWFNDRFMGRELGIERNGRKTFHSFRHNFSTGLGDADVPSGVKSQLLGHARGRGETEGRYDKGRRVAALLEHVRTLSFDLPVIHAFNIDAGLEAVGAAVKLKSAQRRARDR
jgi:integrase